MEILISGVVCVHFLGRIKLNTIVLNVYVSPCFSCLSTESCPSTFSCRHSQSKKFISVIVNQMAIWCLKEAVAHTFWQNFHFIYYILMHQGQTNLKCHSPNLSSFGRVYIYSLHDEICFMRPLAVGRLRIKINIYIHD